MDHNLNLNNFQPTDNKIDNEYYSNYIHNLRNININKANEKLEVYHRKRKNMMIEIKLILV